MDLLTIISGMAGNTLEAIPGSAARTLVQGALARRRKAAFEILLQELRRGGGPLTPGDDAIAAVLRYQRAADEGAARRNLRLMAMVIAGKAFIGNLKSDEFLYVADMLSSLRREEIILLATMQKIRKASLNTEGSPTPEEQWALAEEELIPQPFPDKPAMRAVATACLRTGLLSDANTMDDLGWYSTNRYMDELEALAPFDAALDEDAPP